MFVQLKMTKWTMCVFVLFISCLCYSAIWHVCLGQNICTASFGFQHIPRPISGRCEILSISNQSRWRRYELINYLDTVLGNDACVTENPIWSLGECLPFWHQFHLLLNRLKSGSFSSESFAKMALQRLKFENMDVYFFTLDLITCNDCKHMSSVCGC